MFKMDLAGSQKTWSKEGKFKLMISVRQRKEGECEEQYFLERKYIYFLKYLLGIIFRMATTHTQNHTKLKNRKTGKVGLKRWVKLSWE